MKTTNIIYRLAIASLVVAAVSVSSTISVAQSSSRSNGSSNAAGQRQMMPKKTMPKKTMMQKQAMQTEIGLEGYCPVCIIKQGKWVKGDVAHSATYDGKTYLFPAENIKETFQQDPAAFVPALNGDCIVCYVKGGKRAPGNIRFASMDGERLFLFPSDKERQMFNNEPDQYANADLGADGNCIVCKVKAGKTVPGSTQFTAVHDGFRYLFPSDSERQVFTASPAKYITAESKMMMKNPMMKHSMMDKEKTMQQDSKEMMKSTSMIQIQGTTACAACEFGVTPINAPEELGLAVTTADGQIYVIEEGHSRWPQLYKDRFDGKRVAVSGDVIKTQGNISWINPSQLKTL